jgi:hypothetical protein
VDVDLDVPEAMELAPEFLPVTTRKHGRVSKRMSHWWYVAKPAPRPVRFCDIDGTCIGELRSTGQQTVLPPSTHDSGERIFWEEAGDPAPANPEKLLSCVARLAACTLVARHWPNKGSRHHAAMALSGMLLRNAWTKEEASRFIVSAARSAADEEWEQRQIEVATTARRMKDGGPATGLPTLCEIFGRDVVERLEDWLHLKRLKETDGYFAHTAKWPDPLQAEAFEGLAGDFVRAIEPHSEADPAALLFQFLAAFGNAIGRRPHFLAEADRHSTNLFVAVVGTTSKARKGSSWSHIKQMGEGVDAQWAGERILQGLSSGEGLIWAVRDPIAKREPIRKSGKVVGYETVIADHGVEDKRLLIVEPEFASVLRNLTRDGNTLSPTLRQAWDTGSLRNLTKNSPGTATGAHISVIGHITRDELRRYLNSTEVGNGFANRYLWVCARRSKALPDGGQVDATEFLALVDRLSAVLKYARQVGRLQRSKKARHLWYEVYEELSEGKPGLLGAVTSRAEAQVMRVASIYALLDSAKVIKRLHLKAALAVWKYAEQSARFIFGDSLGDPVADELAKALRKSAHGLTRTEIRDLFGRNRQASEIERALSVLVENGLAQCEVEDNAERGRPSERWFAIRVGTTTITTKSPTMRMGR